MVCGDFLGGAVFHLNMIYFVTIDSIEEINNEINRKKRKFARDIKKPKNVNVLTKISENQCAGVSLRFFVKRERLQQCFSFFLIERDVLS